MKRAKNLNETIACLATVSTGGVFVDHLGQTVERVEETVVATGAGYNALHTVAEYLDLVKYGEKYGSYVCLF